MTRSFLLEKLWDIDGQVFNCWFVLWGTKVSWLEFLPVFPVAEVMLYAMLVIVIIWIAYAVSAKDVKLDNIVDVIKDETL